MAQAELPCMGFRHIELQVVVVLLFGDTFPGRINRWIEQLSEGVVPEDIDASGEDGLAAQEIIEAAIRSWQDGAIAEVGA